MRIFSFFLILSILYALALKIELPPETSVLLVVPGHGQNRRWSMLEASLAKLKSHCLDYSITFHCDIYSYNPLYTADLKKKTFCNVIENHGLWTHHMLKVKSSGYSHIALLMDDVNASNVSIPHAISAMSISRIHLASAAMNGWHYKHMHAFPPPCLVHEVNFVDILFAIFTVQAWDCWISILDPNVNPSGWGYDLIFKRACRMRIGVLDREVARHGVGGYNGEEKAGTLTRTYNSTAALIEMRAYVGKMFRIKNETVQDHIVAKLQKHKYPGIKNRSCILTMSDNN